MARATRSGTRVDTVILAACLFASLLARVLPPDTRQAVAGPIRETFVGPLIGLQVQAERARGAFVSRYITAARLDSLVLRNAELREMELDNERLRSLLGLGARLRTGFVAPEKRWNGEERGRKAAGQDHEEMEIKGPAVARVAGAEQFYLVRDEFLDEHRAVQKSLDAEKNARGRSRGKRKGSKIDQRKKRFEPGRRQVHEHGYAHHEQRDRPLGENGKT